MFGDRPVWAMASLGRKKDMKLTIQRWLAAASWLGACVVWTLTSMAGSAQGVTTTTVQGTIYLANGQPGSGTLQLSWPAFTTASNQAITAGRISVVIGADGYLSVNLAPNQGSTPAGLYYTAVFHLSDGTTSTEYRRLDAAQLFGVLEGADYQFAGEQWTVNGEQSTVRHHSLLLTTVHCVLFPERSPADADDE